MSIDAPRVIILMALATLAAPSLADDCVAAARSAMLSSGHLPRTLTITKIDAQGKQSVLRQIQTQTDKYVQLPNGQWYSMGIAIKDLNDNLEGAKLTCRSGGSDLVNAESASVYLVHLDDDGTVTDSKIWVSSKNLIIKSESAEAGARLSGVYDYSQPTPPANAKPLGAK